MNIVIDSLYLLGLAVISPWLIVRSVRTGRYRQGLMTKLMGGASPFAYSLKKETIVWFHGVSVGEIVLLEKLVTAFQERHPDWTIVVSSTTDTGLAEARKRFNNVIVYPFDFSWAVGRTLDAVRPSLIVLAESELWPNFLNAAASRDIPVAVINARLSPRSLNRLSRLGTLPKRMLFRHVTLFAAQTDAIAQGLRQLGVTDCQLTVTGSLKFDGISQTAEKSTLYKLLIDGLSTKPTIWLAGSTHAPEEEIVLSAFKELRPKYPNLKLILVPRHPDRFDAVANLIEQSGVSSVRRSRIDSPLSLLPDVILLDTIGELRSAWALADLGFTGGSFDGKRGGQSMIEPAGLGVPTLFGPHVWNFRDASRRLIEAEGSIMLREPEQLSIEMERLINDVDARTRMGHAARELVRSQQGATTRTLDALDGLIRIMGTSGARADRSLQIERLSSPLRLERRQKLTAQPRAGDTHHSHEQQERCPTFEWLPFAEKQFQEMAHPLDDRGIGLRTRETHSNKQSDRDDGCSDPLDQPSITPCTSDDASDNEQQTRNLKVDHRCHLRSTHAQDRAKMIT